MAASVKVPFFFFCCCIAPLFFPSSAQCSNYAFRENRAFSNCTPLSQLNAFLHWTLDSTNVQIAYRAPGVRSWHCYALNLQGTGMNGAQSICAYQSRRNSSIMAFTTQLGYSKSPSMKPESLSFAVNNLTAEFISNEIIIYATMALPNRTLNQLWQVGDVSNDDTLNPHLMSQANHQALGSIDFQSGGTTVSGQSSLRRKNVHGVLNAVSWGILMPLGAIFARYLKVFKGADPAWFYLHVSCQVSAYAVGVAGWGTGLKLGSDSVGIVHRSHRRIGIALFCLGTLQVLALLLRPKKDHKYRLYWKIYHSVTGYVVIILSVINIFEGFDILKPDDKWKRAYIGVIVALGAVAVVLEMITWPIFIKAKKSAEKSHHGGIQT